MDTLTVDFGRSDVDTEMRVLTPEDITEQNIEAGDDVENLRNSLREAVHDENVQPKMQCLMMDSSFSMVTMQGEDSGIAWETTPSRCNTPWMSEAGNLTVDLGSQVAVRPTTPGSQPAGKIIFVMDEELMSRRKKTKERVRGQKSKPDRHELEGSFDNISRRRELVEFSKPNVKIVKRREDDDDDEEDREDREDDEDEEDEEDEEEPIDPVVDKEQRLFSLVSEGSEILNIIVPPKLTTVDEDESTEMVDNLSYLEETPVPKATEETHDSMLDLNYGLEIPTQPPAGSGAGIGDQPILTMGPNVMDPPGAPVARPRTRRLAGTEDYFEQFSLIDAQAPGSPSVIAHGQEVPQAEDTTERPDTERPEQSEDNTTTVHNDKSDNISLLEITSDLLDEVFYGVTDNDDMKTDKAEGGGEGAEAAEGVRCRLPSKPSGSNLFGSQEEILTPVFIPKGPPKIIDPILLEEPKAMAFLYTDLYEEAVGSRIKDEDTESMTSEKSFHSRHSDREARGYLEKYALIDETPVVEAEPTEKEEPQEEGSRVLYQDLYDYAESERGDVQNLEEEVTDFFRSSANSSPCDVEPFPRSLEEDEEQPTTKSTVKETKSVSTVTVEKLTEIPEDPFSDLNFTSEDLEWGSNYPPDLEEADLNEYADEELWKEDLEIQKPVAPPRRKATSSPKACLDLTPLTPVEVITQEKEEVCGKEQREEEKEKASPTETADEGDEDGAKAKPTDASPSENTSTPKPSQTENVKDSNEITVLEKDTKPVEEEKRSETEAATKQTEPVKPVDIKSSKSARAEVIVEKQGDSSTALPAEQDKRQCIIL